MELSYILGVDNIEGGQVGNRQRIASETTWRWYCFFGIEFEVLIIYSDGKASRQLNLPGSSEEKRMT